MPPHPLFLLHLLLPLQSFLFLLYEALIFVPLADLVVPRLWIRFFRFMNHSPLLHIIYGGLEKRNAEYVFEQLIQNDC